MARPRELLESAPHSRPPPPGHSSGPRARAVEEVGSRPPEPMGPTAALERWDDCAGPSPTRQPGSGRLPVAGPPRPRLLHLPLCPSCLREPLFLASASPRHLTYTFRSLTQTQSHTRLNRNGTWGRGRGELRKYRETPLHSRDTSRFLFISTHYFTRKRENWTQGANASR